MLLWPSTGSDSQEQPYPGVSAIDESPLIASFCELLSPKFRTNNFIPTHVVFQWSLWKEIVHVNRGNLDNPFRQLQEASHDILDSARDWQSQLSDEIHDPVRDSADQLSRRIEIDSIAWIQERILEDHAHQYKKDHWLNEDRGSPHSAFVMNPWLAALLIRGYSFTAMLKTSPPSTGARTSPSLRPLLLPPSRGPIF